MNTLLQADHLVKRFQDKTAVDDVSLAVAQGEVLGFLGPNGAGKTTTMRMLTGYLEPNSGKVTVCGIDLEQNPLSAKAKIGYLPEGAPLYSDMQVDEYLRFVGSARGLRGATLSARLKFVREACDISFIWKHTIS